MSKDPKENEIITKIPVEIEETNYLYFMHYLGNSEQDLLFSESEANRMGLGGLRKRASKIEEKLRKYNGKLISYVDKVKQRLHRLKFYECYAENPLRFTQNFIVQQNGLLKMFKEDTDIVQDQAASVEMIEEEQKQKQKVEIKDDIKEPQTQTLESKIQKYLEEKPKMGQVEQNVNKPTISA